MVVPKAYNKCPDCKFYIDPNWVRCWYCGHDFDEKDV